MGMLTLPNEICLNELAKRQLIRKLPKAMQ